MGLGTLRTLMYWAIAGCCSKAATYPLEVVRRQLQMQVHTTKMSAAATFKKIVDQGGIPALYAGLIPSLLMVLPSSSISYFVYELMKIVLKVEPEQVFVSFFKRYTPCNELFGK
ncbi:putative mitochondrial carrier domain protein [Helianthus annuus]|uniref:Mitochondrial carrier domain protein n=1 Tax=Helianthus annuus TaxID=4232 RepID=A0A9K3JMZ5_HELAN|nr:putative mitochondrial carrier domain protein [Helianthus annuus]